MRNLEFDDIHQLFNVDDFEVLHVEEIAKLTKMHVESVRRWCRSGKLPSYQFGGKFIVTGSDFKTFMKRSKVKPKWEQGIKKDLSSE
ncbi:helix-turn-helix domain-containing protein [Cytobacillus praedii]|uniref:helix-turn-helix domain-containing protein n=1 Tax=Cytobacillus praedii TaxID=1742358 RepID=UPI002E1D2906|nr:helix-turn-helix domain-containing protein [Cytobacillus praedii]